jgi:hypothetical protein
LRNVTKRAVGCGGRGDGGDDRLKARTAKSCGPGAPMLASSFAGGDIREMKVAKKPVTWESTK